MLDRSRPYSQTIGESFARFHQDGKDFDTQGNEIGAADVVTFPAEPVEEPVKRKPGRPAKVSHDLEP